MNIAVIMGLIDKIREAAGKMKFLSATTLDIIKTVCIIATLCLVTIDSYNNTKKEHLDPTTRFVISGKIRQDLTELREFSGAGKVFVLGYHNGIANFTRVPFVFADMRYEVTADSIEYTSDMFSNISLDKFAFAEQHIMDKEWYGPVSHMKDARLEGVLKKYGVTYIHFSNISDDRGIPIASVVLCWYNKDTNTLSAHYHNIVNAYVRNIKTSLLKYQ